MILDSLLAVFAVILIGWLARRHLLTQADAWNGMERVTYYLLFPALIIVTLARADLAGVPFLRMAGVLIAANLVLVALLFALRAPLARLIGLDGPGFTSLFQGVTRWNTFVALAIAGNLYGNEGLALASVAVATLLPILNVEAVWVLRRYGSGSNGSLLRGILTNPFIIGTAIGLAINLTGLPLPRAGTMVLDILGRCSLGAGLLLVGAGLMLKDLARPTMAVALGTLLRLLVMPLVGAGLALAAGLSGAPFAIVLISLAVPSASAAYLLARQMGGDAPLMAAILSAQTLASALTIPALIWAFSRFISP